MKNVWLISLGISGGLIVGMHASSLQHHMLTPVDDQRVPTPDGLQSRIVSPVVPTSSVPKYTQKNKIDYGITYTLWYRGITCTFTYVIPDSRSHSPARIVPDLATNLCRKKRKLHT